MHDIYRPTHIQCTCTYIDAHEYNYYAHLVFCLLQEKRSAFPRFYFIGDEDLLEILGQATQPEVIQSHLKKLFAGIHSVSFSGNYQQILSMRSLDGEVVPLSRPVTVTTDVEVGGCGYEFSLVIIICRRDILAQDMYMYIYMYM